MCRVRHCADIILRKSSVKKAEVVGRKKMGRGVRRCEKRAGEQECVLRSAQDLTDCCHWEGEKKGGEREESDLNGRTERNGGKKEGARCEATGKNAFKNKKAPTPLWHLENRLFCKRGVWMSGGKEL